jgi:hypothetical protein
MRSRSPPPRYGTNRTRWFEKFTMAHLWIYFLFYLQVLPQFLCLCTKTVSTCFVVDRSICEILNVMGHWQNKAKIGAAFKHCVQNIIF